MCMKFLNFSWYGLRISRVKSIRIERVIRRAAWVREFPSIVPAIIAAKIILLKKYNQGIYWYLPLFNP